MKSLSEEQIQSAILHYLWSIGYPAFPVSNRPLYDPKSARYIRREADSVDGVPDIVCPCRDGATVYFEVKSAVGKLRESQRLYLLRLELMGHKLSVVRSVDEVRVKLSAWGLGRER